MYYCPKNSSKISNMSLSISTSSSCCKLINVIWDNKLSSDVFCLFMVMQQIVLYQFGSLWQNATVAMEGQILDAPNKKPQYPAAAAAAPEPSWCHSPFMSQMMWIIRLVACKVSTLGHCRGFDSPHRTCGCGLYPSWLHLFFTEVEQPPKPPGSNQRAACEHLE